MLRKLLFVVAITLQINALSQNKIDGQTIDSNTKLPVSFVHIIVNNHVASLLTDIDGRFEFSADRLPVTLHFRAIGYQSDSVTLPATVWPKSLKIELLPVAVNLEEINILSDQARLRYNPIAFSAVSQKKIILEVGDKPLPEILNFTPGLFANREGGGSGDASLRIRGFEQENIAVLLNGVPVNGAENGLVYWNNWMGLTEIAASIQVQRGIGASKVALNSVGGTVNIVTFGSEQDKKLSASMQTTDYGNKKFSIAFQSGLTKKGWNVSFLASRSSGEGYIAGTYVDGWAYFASLSKEISSRQRVVMSILGGPERHGQRNQKLSKAETDQYGYDFNKEWGFLNGKLKNSSENFYHKPHLSVNHYLNLPKEGLLASAVYFSPGKGGGKWNDNFGYERNLFSFRDENGQLAWDDVIRYNENNTDTFELSTGEKVSGYSKIVQTNYLASHIWTGIISGLELKTGARSKFYSGIHYRFFLSDLRQEVADLLGGKFYLDDYGWSLAGLAGRNQIKMPGDVIRVHNGAMIHQTTLFAQYEKRWELLDYFAAASLSDNRFKRHDEYNYPANKWSEWVSKPGFDLKTGLGYRYSERQHFFVNAAFFSKAPYYKFIFGNYNNIPSLNIRNEKVKTFEAGYNYTSSNLNLNLSAYFTEWKDVSFLSNEYIQLENNSQTRAMVNGLASLHKGLEAEMQLKPLPALQIRLMASFGDWKWKNDVSAKLLNDLDVVVDTVNVFANGLYVGGQPQFQAGISISTILFKKLILELEWLNYDKHYAQFDPAGRQNSDDRAQPVQLDPSNYANISFNLPLVFKEQKVILFGKVNNLFDSRSIVSGEDGSSHELDTFRGYWSFGRTFDFGLRLELDVWQ